MTTGQGALKQDYFAGPRQFLVQQRATEPLQSAAEAVVVLL